ncbi:RidA family protein [candidate division KSB1 bacterium]|nr:RidA family protein [candidate division KSB1 bacterium]
MIDQKLAELGFTIDNPPEPIGNYEAAVISGNMLYISGQLPLSDGKLVYQGRVGSDLSVSEGYLAAELAAVNVLAQIKKKLGTFDRLVKIVRVDGHISSSDDFIEQPKVLDGASDLFKKILDEKAGHARAVFGYSMLPKNATIELVVIAEIKY